VERFGVPVGDVGALPLRGADEPVAEIVPNTQPSFDRCRQASTAN
jgi:hypothetical protein